MKNIFFRRPYFLFVVMALAAIALRADPASAGDSSSGLAVPPGIVAWWPGDGNANDIAGNNNGTTENGVLFLPGIVGEAFALSGGANIEIPNSANLHFTDSHPMTLELWAYRTGTGTTMHIVSKRNEAYEAEYQMAFDPQLGLHFGSIRMPWALSMVATGIQMPLNQWWHLAGTFDGAILRFYINGELAASTPGSLGASNSEPVRLGTIDYPPLPNSFEGLLDEVTIYSRALSADEIRSLFEAGPNGKIKPPANSGSPATPPPGLVSWWPADGDATDMVGNNNGILQNGAQFAAGLAGKAFLLTNGAYVEIPNSDSLHFTGSSPMTVELWAYRTGTNTTMHIVSKRVGALEAEYQLAFDPQYGLHFGSIRMPWALSLVETGIQMPLNQWWHLAGTYDGTILRFYINGKLAASAPGSLGASNAEPVRLGAIDYPPLPNSFEGLLDEVSIYNRDLSAEEIQAIYQAGSQGKSKSIFVLEEPQSQMGYWGKDVTFDIAVKGPGPFSYQWLKNGVPLTGATGATLYLSDLKLSDAGSYSVVVTAPNGSATSTPAVLKINPAGVSLGMYSGLAITGVVGRTYTIQYATQILPTMTWQTLTNITLTSPSQLWIDSSVNLRASGLSNRIYQVLPANEVTPGNIAQLICIDFDNPLNISASSKSGPAAVGNAGDFWNLFGCPWLTDATVTNLLNADRTVSGVGLEVSNLPGCWGVNSTDPMYGGYLYSYTGNGSITITNLPAGSWNVYAYVFDGANYELTVGSTNYGIRTSSYNYPVVNPPPWVSGVHYVAYTNVVVSPGQSMVLNLSPSAGDGYATISGLQLARMVP